MMVGVGGPSFPFGTRPIFRVYVKLQGWNKSLVKILRLREGQLDESPVSRKEVDQYDAVFLVVPMVPLYRLSKNIQDIPQNINICIHS